MNDEYGHGLPPEVIQMQRDSNRMNRSIMEIIAMSFKLPRSTGNLMRTILRQAHEVLDIANEYGAWYVLYEKGCFYLYPFGRGEEWRHSYQCRLDYSLEFWIFEVMP